MHDLHDAPLPATEKELKREPLESWKPTLHAPRTEQLGKEEAAGLAPSAGPAAPPPATLHACTPPTARPLQATTDPPPPATRAKLEEEVKANRQLLAFAKQQPAAKQTVAAELEALANGALARCHSALLRMADEDAATALSATLPGDSAEQPARESRPPVGYWPTP